jgi:hypothetical protein
MSAIEFLWLDDARPPTTDKPWHWVQSAEEALEILKTGSVVIASLDHDLEFPVDREAPGVVARASYQAGAKDGTWLAEQMVKFRAFPSYRTYLHSANKEAARRMATILRSFTETHYRRDPR